MDIERKMRAVECDVVFKCEPQLPTQRTSYWLQPWPEQTVMDDQEIDVAFYRLGRNARRNIDRRADARDPTGIFDLQTVERIVPIAHVTNMQIPVRVTYDFGKRRHDYLVGLSLQIYPVSAPNPNSQKKLNHQIPKRDEARINADSTDTSRKMLAAAWTVVSLLDEFLVACDFRQV